MIAPPEVLVLEDDLGDLHALERVIREAHLEPIPAAGPRQALARLACREPLLAVVDLDMALAPPAERRASVHDVLRRLHSHHPNCIPLVYSAGVDTIDEQARVYESHPHALFQSKRHGLERLLERIEGLLGGHVGDLAVRRGSVVHLPSGQTMNHRVGVALLAAQRANRSVLLRDSDARAARRFQDWLDAVGSCVVVRALGGRHYQVALRPDRGPAR
jgi:DNA-binding NarL/FixJ family response regulator